MADFGDAPDVGTIGGGLEGGGYGQMDFGGGYGGSSGYDPYMDIGIDMSSLTDSPAMGPTDFNAAMNYGPGMNFGQGTSLADIFSEDRLKNFALSQVLGRLGPMGNLAARGTMAGMSKDPSRAMGSLTGQTMGQMLGSSFGPLGTLAGGWLGSKVGNLVSGFEAGRAPGQTQAIGEAGRAGRGASGGGGGEFGLGDVVQGLAGLYQGNQAAKSAREASGVAGQQTQQLADLYGPASPYAQQLRQQLERRDAASGRRSQYGPREVELQAKLADVASRNAPNVLGANKQALEMRQAGTKTGAQQLAQMMSLANKSGLTGWAEKGLRGLFDSDTGASSWPSAQGAVDYAASVGSAPSSFWE